MRYVLSPQEPNTYKQINDESIINFKQLLAKNQTAKAGCVVSRLSDLWIIIPSRDWWEIFTIGLFFISFPLKLCFLLASAPFMAFILSDHKLALKIHLSVPRHEPISADCDTEMEVSSLNAEICG